ncbi:MAG TPA: beta-ketoacyl synthase N-terminal-like domain-containing protein [Candidatus Acidoferrales bacterium]|nr:beta-ketoacyl synthase N-terminal-like domain-containing protein [Candidatus Acidoferrales bacterium]
MSDTFSTHSNDPADIAIVGMACVFPGARDLQTYWENIISKFDAVSDPPEDWETEHFYDPNSTDQDNDRTYAKRGGYLGDLAEFDPLQYGVMPNSVDGGEPAQFLALRVAHEALMDAGYGKEAPDRQRVSVILGRATYLNRGHMSLIQHTVVVDQTLRILKQLYPDYTDLELKTIKQALKANLPPFNAEVAPGLVPNIASGRIANRFDFMGPNYTIDAACASSLIAVEQGMRDLRTGKSNLAIVGGVQPSTPAPVTMLFCQLNAISRKGRIRPFDKDADGTLLGEGIGMVVLKRREDAERAGDRIYALLKGVGIASDGRALGLFAPRVEGEELALRRAYEEAGVSPNTVGLIEAHGTGTPVGDANEIAALTRVFGNRQQGRIPSCAVGTVKSMISHLIPAAGIAGLIKTALALYHRVLPPTLHVETPNPKLELEKTPFYINSETRPWIHGHTSPRRAGVNAFGFGGINAHAVMEEYPAARPADLTFQRRWPSELCVVQGASRASLIEECERVERFASSQRKTELRDIAYTLNAQLTEGTARLAVIASSPKELGEKLRHALSELRRPECSVMRDNGGIYFFEEPLAKNGKLAFVFPGEGSQYVGMLSELCVHFPQTRAWFDLVDRSCVKKGRERLPSQVIFPPPLWVPGEGVNPELWQMEVGPAAVLTANHAILSLVNQLQIRPDVMLGHSTGEYSALEAAGVFRFASEDALMQSTMTLDETYQTWCIRDGSPQGILLVVSGIDPSTILSLVEQKRDDLYLAMDNCPHQVILCGSRASIEQAAQELRSKGAICSELPFQRAYHTPVFQPFCVELERIFSNLPTHPPRCELYSCATAQPFPTDPCEIRTLAFEQWARPVRFRETIEAMYKAGARLFLEVGPRGNLTAFIDDILSTRPRVAVAADVPHRSGITQLNHMLGLLSAHGVAMQLGPLYTHRAAHAHSREGTDDRAEGRNGTHRSVPLAMGLQTLRLPADFSLPGSETPSQASAVRSDLVTAGQETSGSRDASSALAVFGKAMAEKAAGTTPKPNGHNGSNRSANKPEKGAEASLGIVDTRDTDFPSEVMQQHLRTMEQFLETERAVLQAYFDAGRGVSPHREGTPDAPNSSAEWTFPDVARMPAPSANKNILPEANPETLTPESTLHQSAPETPADGWARENLGETLRQLIAEKTGYPLEMIEPTADLEADLGIDSIKRLEILGALNKLTGFPRAEDMDRVAKLGTIRGIVALAAELVSIPASAANRPIPAGTTPSALPLLSEPSIHGDQLSAIVRFSLDEHPFLRDHTLGEPACDHDADLTGLPFVPLTFSMEVMAEAAAALVPERVVVRMENIRASRWIMIDREDTRVHVVAKRSDASGTRVDVRMQAMPDPSLHANRPRITLAEATVVLATSYPEAPEAPAFDPTDARPSKWSHRELYGGAMFHGPCLQAVKSIERTSKSLMEGTLEALPKQKLLRATSDPHFLIGPVILDAAGQIVGYWALEHFNSSSEDLPFEVLPFEIVAVEMYGPDLGEGERVRCRAHISLPGDSQIRSNIELISPSGRLHKRILGWRHKRFDVPDRFYRALRAARKNLLSTPWPGLASGCSNSTELFCCRSQGLSSESLQSNGGIWHRVLAHIVLTHAERTTWRNLEGGERRRIEWVLAQTVEKDAVRMLLAQRQGIELSPAEIELAQQDNGRTVVHSVRGRPLATTVSVSVAQAGDMWVGVAWDDQQTMDVAVCFKPLGPSGNGLHKLALHPEAQEVLAKLSSSELEEWNLRLSCAQDAVGKVLRKSTSGELQDVIIRRLDRTTGSVEMTWDAKQGTSMDPCGVAHTHAEDGWVTATSIVAQRARARSAGMA